MLHIENRLSVDNTFSEKDIYKFTWVKGVNGRKTLMYDIVLQGEDKNKVLNVNVFRSAGERIFNHQLVIAKGRCLRRW